MEIKRFHIPGPFLLTRPVHGDDRGTFTEFYNSAKFQARTGFSPDFVQDNLSVSAKSGTLRGLHLQTPPTAQAKYVSCISGEILDVIVDVRTNSPTFKQHISVVLKGGDGLALWVPEGFLHGFITRKPDTIVGYKVTHHYDKDCDISVMWDDPELGIDWGLDRQAPTLSEKDAAGLAFADFNSPFRVQS